MTRCSLPIGLAMVLLAPAFAGDKKKPGPVTVNNDNVEIVATVLTDKAEIQQALGAEPPADIVVVQVKMTPKEQKPLAVTGDDFQLLSHKDGQKSQPFSPTQLAGKGSIVVKTAPGQGGGMAGQRSGPVWGGIPGTGGRPRQLDTQPGSAGNTGDASGLATAETRNNDKESPLLALLKEKVLPDKEISEPVSGLLLFPIEGKVKAKDLALLYRGPAGRLALEFDPKQQ